MIQIKIEDETKTLEHLANQLSDKKLNVANVRSINVAIRKANTNYRRQLVANYNLKYADTKEMVSPKRATYGQPTGSISGQSRPISLSRFNPSFQNSGQVFSIKSVKNKETGKRGLSQLSKKAGKKDNYAGVSFEVKKGQRKTLPFAFMLKDDSRGGFTKQIWARGKYEGNKFIQGNFPPPGNSKSKTAVTALKSVSPFGGMTKEDISGAIEKGASDDLAQEFERQVNMLLKQAGAK